MQYTTLGRTGVVVSRLVLGTMTFGVGAPSTRGFTYTIDQEQANQIVSQALDAGINFFDTADAYAQGRSEELLGHALGTRRSEVILATKVGARVSSQLHDTGLSARHIIAAVEASLKRLKTDSIDLLQLHRPDALTPFEETAQAFDDLIRRGLVRYIGYSNLSAWQAAKALAIQQAQHFAHFVSAQMHYSLLGRDIEYEIIPFLQDAGLGLLVWSPLAGGFLTGKYTRENPTGSNGRLASFDVLNIDREQGYQVNDLLRKIAGAHGEATPAQVALAWLLSKPYVTSVIVGVSKPQQFADNVAAATLVLAEEELEALDALTTPKPLYPYSMLTRSTDPQIQQALQRPSAATP